MMKTLLVSALPLIALCSCAEPPPPQVQQVPVYVDRPVVVPVRRAPAPSDRPEDFRAVEKPSTYSQ